jgi:O-antigen ligase
MRACPRLGADRETCGGSRPGGAPIGIEDPVGHARRTTAAGWRDLLRPATVVLLLVPLSVLGGGTSTAGRLAAVATVATLAPVAAALVVMRILPFRQSYLWIVLFAGLLILSFVYPQVVEPGSPQAVRPRIVGLLGVLRGLTPSQLSRLPELIGLLVGLALTGLCVVASPHPRQVARVIVLSGTAAAGYALVRGGFDNTRLEGLGCNPNYLGFVLALPLVAAVGLMRYARNPRWLLPAGVCAIALSATHSRGAFLAAALGVAVVLVQGRSWLFRALLASVAVAVTGTAAATGMLRSMGRHIENLGAGGRSVTDLSLSNGMRLKVAKFATRVIMGHPLRGIGYAMFPGYAERSPHFGVYLATHDDYLRLAAEAGIPALAAFLVLLWQGTRCRQVGDPALLRALVLAYAVILFFANPLASLVVSAPFWVALGSLLACGPGVGRGAAAPKPAGALRGVWRIARSLRPRLSRGGADPHA